MRGVTPSERRSLIRVLHDTPADAVADRLDSWKDVAAYLRRDVSTVQRWEKREGLPVHRHLHDKQGSVYAFKSELDAWWQQGRKRLEGSGSGNSGDVQRRGARHWMLRQAAATSVLLLAAAIVVGVWWFDNAPARPGHVVRSIIPLPPEAVSAFAMALSPDGAHLVYVGALGQSRGLSQGRGLQLYLKATNELTSRPIPGTEDARRPFFSPDGKWIGFFAGGELKKVAVSGGAPITLCAAPNSRGATWGPRDTIVFASHYLSGLSRVSGAGGDPVPVTVPDRAALERSHREPHFLPGGRDVLFMVHRVSHETVDDAEIETVSIETGARTRVGQAGMLPTYTASGHLVYGRAGVLFAVPFDATRSRITGTPFPVVEGVLHNAAEGRMAFAASDSGTLVYAPGRPPFGSRRLMWVDRTGNGEPVLNDRRRFMSPRISPDGSRIAVTIDTGIPRIWLYDVARSTLTRLTGEWDAEAPFWAPDSARIAFFGNQFRPDGRRLPTLYSHSRDASDDAVPILTGSAGVGNDWSPDGSRVAFQRASPSTRSDIWLVTTGGNATVTPFIAGAANEFGARFSRDGRWVAYVSDESGRNEVYVRDVARPNRRWQVSSDGGGAPIWAHDGGELFYRDESRLMSVTVSGANTFVAGRPAVLFDGSYVAGPLQNYDVGPDGRFVMMEEGDDAFDTSELVFVQNWFEELRQKIAPP